MSVDSLSDSELRTKLMEYGYPVGPVTQTTRKILVKKLKNLIETRGLTGTRHSLAARYSSDETDEDTSSTVVKRKKSSGSSRRQTLANPMPPPSMVPVAPETSVSKSLIKDSNVETVDNIMSEPVAGSIFSNRIITSIQKKNTKVYNSNLSDGLETGSDSDVREDTSSTYAQSRYSTNIGKPYTSKRHTKRTVGDDQVKKTYEPKPQSVHSLTDNKYVETSFKNYNVPIQSPKEDTTGGRSSSKELLANYETPFLSEFARKLSTRTSLDLPPVSLPTIEKDSNGHFPSLRSLYSTPETSPRPVTASADRSRNNIAKKFKSRSTNKEDIRNNQNMVSVILVVVLALFFGVLAVIYLGLGGKSETFPSLSMGRYSEI